MKKILMSFLLVCVANLSTFAAEGTNPGTGTNMVSKTALRSFAFQFFDATNVTWKVSEEYQKAIFNKEGKVLCAMFDLDGQFLMASEQVLATDLPQHVKNDLQSKYVDYRISDVVRVVARPAGYDKDDDIGSYWIALVKGQEIAYLVAAPGKSAKVISKGSIK